MDIIENPITKILPIYEHFLFTQLSLSNKSLESNFDEANILKLYQEGKYDNFVDQNGNNLLHYASNKGYFQVVKSLILNGANINEKGKNGTTPLLYATMANNNEIAIYLVSKGAEIDAQSSIEATPTAQIPRT